MPSPKRYKNQKNFMHDCMHQNVTIEKKSPEQSIPKCLNMWRDRRKKMAAKIARNIIAELSGSESLYGFCGWLTTREKETVMSGHDDAGCIVDLIDDFCKTNNLTQPRDGWDKELVHPKNALNYSNIKMEKIVPEGWPKDHWVPVCESCLEKHHISYGTDHMPPKGHKPDENELGRWSCKNVGMIDGKTYQCNCSAGFTELLKKIDPKTLHVSTVIHNFLDDTITAKKADYPDHPKDRVLPKSEWSSRPVTEIDVYNYYSGAGKKMLPELKGRNLFIAVVPKNYQAGQKPIYIRHPYHGNTEFIRIGNTNEFEEYHSGRTVEYHVTMPQMAPYYVIDFDAPGKFSQTKKITAEIADELEKLAEVKKVEIRYTGKRGFHILGWLKKPRDVNDARNFLKGWLKETFGDRDDVVVGESPKGNKGALGLSPMKINGGQVALWSLRVSGLCCVEVPRAKLGSFKREDASIDKIYKKATGKEFDFGKERAASVINAFINEDAREVCSAELPSRSDILKIRHDLAKAAQKVYDEWNEDRAEELAGGGICQDIAEAITEVLDHHGIEAGTVSATSGEQHVYAVAKVKEGVFEVDISPHTYERGSGYQWKKIPNVEFGPNDITVSLIHDDPNKYEECIE